MPDHRIAPVTEIQGAIRTEAKVDDRPEQHYAGIRTQVTMDTLDSGIIPQLHGEVMAWLAQRGVATILVASHLGLLGASMTAPIDASYLADNVIMLRYFEATGEIRQAVPVVKKRSGWHERTIREFRFRDGAIEIGEPLHEFQGVLTGTPIYSGGGDALISRAPP